MAGVLEVWAAAEQGRTAQGHPQGHLSDCYICMLTFQIFPGISLGEEAIQGSILTAHTRGGDEYLLGLLGPRCTLPSKHAAERASVCSGGGRIVSSRPVASWRGIGVGVGQTGIFGKTNYTHTKHSTVEYSSQASSHTTWLPHRPTGRLITTCSHIPKFSQYWLDSAASTGDNHDSRAATCTIR